MSEDGDKMDAATTRGADEAVDDAATDRPAGASDPLESGQTDNIAPGSQVVVRDELWLVRSVSRTQRDQRRIEVTGVSEFVRGSEAVFFEKLDTITALDPRKTVLVADPSSRHRRGRLYLEAAIRKSFLPQTERGLALAENFLMDRQVHQLRPAELALSMRNLQPRLLIADVVGLGKTLEIGILLAELIRRGRGERILVVTPQQVLEQFQRELWTRFGIPLVRLDSTGIQRIQREIPAGRNPFEYFKRAIISVDTLKNQSLYRHHLDASSWDAVVIDESHNLINPGSQRNELARALAHRTDALILASATPHNGDPKSFAELVGLLDPVAIADPNDYDAKDLEHLFIRRSKVSPEVRHGLKGDWADRGPSLPVHVRASEKEEAVFRLLAEQWIPAKDAGASVAQSPLDAYTLMKSFLSSHKALGETVAKRIKTLSKPERVSAADRREREAVEELGRTAAAITDADSSKLAQLVVQLENLKVRPGGETRVVVFSERIATLKWLAAALPGRLGFSAAQAGEAIIVMHADAMNDQEQARAVERFGLRDDPVRILLTGDIASEGVNLHQQCHFLIHYDLPWSLIRIEQRNGRIDRYGQRHRPEFRALILTSEATASQVQADGVTPRLLDDRLVGEKLLDRERHAHEINGSAEGVSGLFDAVREEKRMIADVVAGKSPERSLEDSHGQQPGIAAMSRLLGMVGTAPAQQDVRRAEVPCVFGSSEEYFMTALQEAYGDGMRLNLDMAANDDDGTFSFRPPSDLLHRLRALPDTYLKERFILGGKDRDPRLLVSFDKKAATESLKAALASKNTQWPTVSYLTDVHPVLDWATDKALISLGLNEAFVLGANVAEPVFLIQGSYANAAGRTTILDWMAVTGLPGNVSIRQMQEVLDEAGVGPRMHGVPVAAEEIRTLQELVPHAVDAARAYLEGQREEYDRRVEEPLRQHREKLAAWEQGSLFEAASPAGRRLAAAAADRAGLVDSLQTVGAPMLRVLAVLTGGA